MTTEKPIQPSTDFNALIQTIRNTDTQLAVQARRAVSDRTIQDAVVPGKSSTSNSADTVCTIVYSTG